MKSKLFTAIQFRYFRKFQKKNNIISNLARSILIKISHSRYYMPVTRTKHIQCTHCPHIREVLTAAGVADFDCCFFETNQSQRSSSSQSVVRSQFNRKHRRHARSSESSETNNHASVKSSAHNCTHCSHTLYEFHTIVIRTNQTDNIQ